MKIHFRIIYSKETDYIYNMVERKRINLSVQINANSYHISRFAQTYENDEFLLYQYVKNIITDL